MVYYHDLITEKSWKVLQELRREYDFILIGGWAVYLYTKSLKSRDIDFICDYELLQKLKSRYDLVKNDRLKKYEIHMGEFDVDIYVPFFSDLGIPVEDLQKHVRVVEGFRVLDPEALLILKQKAYSERAASAKGEKDKIDIFSLLFKSTASFDIEKYLVLLEQYKLLDFRQQLESLFAQTKEVPEIDLSAHAFAKLKKSILSQLSS